MIAGRRASCCCVNKAIITPFTPQGDAAGMGKQCSRLTSEQYKHTPGVTIDINITGAWDQISKCWRGLKYKLCTGQPGQESLV